MQHPRADPWAPTAQLGQQFGAAAARLAGAAGLPSGITVWVDLEGVAPATQAQDAIDYCNAWFDQVSAVGFLPGIYIGASPGLTADQLYWDIQMKSYWRGGSSVKSGVPLDIPNRGYQMSQRLDGPPTNEFDHNVIKTDNFGGAIQWIVPL